LGHGVPGSSALVGTLELGPIQGRKRADGVTLAEAMRAVGLEPEHFREARRKRSEFAGYLELHIEQGRCWKIWDWLLGLLSGSLGPCG